MKRNKFDAVIILVAIMASGLSLMLGQFDLLLASIAIASATLAKPWTRYVVILAFVFYIFNSITTNSFSIIGVVFWFLITSRMYSDWQTTNTEITFINLDETMTGYYANLFLILIGLNLVINWVFSGFDIKSTLSFISLFAMLSSSLQFLGIYMLAMRIFEGCYFYAGYIFVNLLMIIMIAIFNGLSGLGAIILIYLMHLVMMYLFKIRNY